VAKTCKSLAYACLTLYSYTWLYLFCLSDVQGPQFPHDYYKMSAGISKKLTGYYSKIYKNDSLMQSSIFNSATKKNKQLNYRIVIFLSTNCISALRVPRPMFNYINFWLIVLPTLLIFRLIDSVKFLTVRTIFCSTCDAFLIL